MAANSDFVTRKELEGHLEKLATKADLEHAFVVLSDNIRAVGASVERVESHVRGLAEALTSTREQLERKIDSLDERLSARITALEDVVRQNSRDIQKNSEDIRKNSEDIRKNSEDIQQLQLEVADLRRQLVRREKLEELDQRITTIEKRVGITPK